MMRFERTVYLGLAIAATVSLPRQFEFGGGQRTLQMDLSRRVRDHCVELCICKRKLKRSRGLEGLDNITVVT